MAPEILVAAVILVALVAYALTGGADFGGGVWDLLAVGSRARAQRKAIEEAIGPIWEANHVWLIVVIVLLFVCFPSVYATIGTALHIPLMLMLLGVVARGTSFVFRHYDQQRDAVHYRWSLVFGVASVVTPVTFGMCVGAVASGRLRVVDGVVQTDFVSEWLAPFPFAVGLYTLALFAFLAATYLADRTLYRPLREDFRRRALVSGVVTGVLAFATVALAREGAPLVWEGLFQRHWSFEFQVATGVVAMWALWDLWWRRYRRARILAMVQVTLILLGWGAAVWPYLIVPDLTVHGAAAPANVQWMVLGTLGGGAVLLVPSFAYLYRVFRAV